MTFTLTPLDLTDVEESTPEDRRVRLALRRLQSVPQAERVRRCRAARAARRRADAQAVAWAALDATEQLELP